MSNDIIQIKSITHLHELMGFDKPKHPLISVIDVSKVVITEDMLHTKLSSSMYSIALKSANCGMRYGRNNYDFEEGVLAFYAPNQVMEITGTQDFDQNDGWILHFHPDLIRNTPLGEGIDNYTFFDYDVHEALHLSDQEKVMLGELVKTIRTEYNERIDGHSQRVIVSALELLLNYCSRYYERQFHTRTNFNKDILSQVESALKEHYKKGQLEEYGAPSVQFLADKVNLSAHYLSDLLKKETGRSAKDHINEFLVEKAKNLLLASGDSVSEIAYSLGFNYPHYFSRMFKVKTGMTPQKYRETTIG